MVQGVLCLWGILAVAAIPVDSSAGRAGWAWLGEALTLAEATCDGTALTSAALAPPSLS